VKPEVAAGVGVATSILGAYRYPWGHSQIVVLIVRKRIVAFGVFKTVAGILFYPPEIASCQGVGNRLNGIVHNRSACIRVDGRGVVLGCMAPNAIIISKQG
jgi:hypothetical protein